MLVEMKLDKLIDMEGNTSTQSVINSYTTDIFTIENNEGHYGANSIMVIESLSDSGKLNGYLIYSETYYNIETLNATESELFESLKQLGSSDSDNEYLIDVAYSKKELDNLLKQFPVLNIEKGLLKERAKAVTIDKLCKRCDDHLYESELDDYTYQCFTCDEDFYAFEQ